MTRSAVALLALALLATPFAVEAQLAGKVYRLRMLSPAAPPPSGMYDGRRDLVAVLREQALGLTIPPSVPARADEVTQ